MKLDATQVQSSLPKVTVVMPTYNQATFIRRALDSLYAQALSNWELLIVDDGSVDTTARVIARDLADERIRYYKLDSNRGLGAAINYALPHARASVVAYLPSDDVYYSDHLACLVEQLDNNPSAILVYSGVRYQHERRTYGQIEGYPLQLVQVMHRLTADRWVERDELVTDDLDRLFWSKLRARGSFICTSIISCEWVSHPHQRHKMIREHKGPIDPYREHHGGLNPYRQYYGVRHPLRFQSSVGNYIDEVSLYETFRTRADTRFASDGLRILLVGELSWNPERVLALEERGHKLYGLWTPAPQWWHMVGPVPFGHIEDISWTCWRDAVKKVKPDLIYALLNYRVVPFAHEVMKENLEIPFVWHLKESPFLCLENGTWPQLVELYTYSDGQIYNSKETRDWFDQYLLHGVNRDQSLILDGELPKQDWFNSVCSPRVSQLDGQIHTVVAGRPLGLQPEFIGTLATLGIHLHFYGDLYQGRLGPWITQTQQLAGKYFHLHPNVDQRNWVSEFSRYDAGWLHVFRSANKGEVRRATWNDLNIPTRIATLAAAGAPTIQFDNAGSIVSMQAIAQEFGTGTLFRDAEQLHAQLSDTLLMARLRDKVWQCRNQFTFDFHADRVIAFFRRVIANRR